MQRFKQIWMGVVIAGWSTLLVASVFERSQPAENWLEVKSVHVSDTSVGVPPKMAVDRTIRQDFAAQWIVDVEQQADDTHGYVRVCSTTGDSFYALENVLPVALDLDWWTWPTQCTPTVPGRYRVETAWIIRLNGGLTKTLRVLSNTFTVTAAPAVISKD